MKIKSTISTEEINDAKGLEMPMQTKNSSSHLVAQKKGFSTTPSMQMNVDGIKREVVVGSEGIVIDVVVGKEG